jgi:hypothetical protein
MKKGGCYYNFKLSISLTVILLCLLGVHVSENADADEDDEILEISDELGALVEA